MFQTQSPTRRPSKRLSYPDSVRFLNNIKRYLPSEYGRTSTLASILGCGLRTARRLLHTKDEDVPRLRKVYLRSAVQHTGESALSLVNRIPAESEIQSQMDRIMQDIPKLDQFKEMATLAASMAARSMFGYGMPASFAVDSNADLEPTALRMQFRKLDNPGCAHEVAIVRDPFYKWQMVYNHPGLGERFRGGLSDEGFERLLSFVKNLPTKHK